MSWWHYNKINNQIQQQKNQKETKPKTETKNKRNHNIWAIYKQLRSIISRYFRYSLEFDFVLKHALRTVCAENVCAQRPCGRVQWSYLYTRCWILSRNCSDSGSPEIPVHRVGKQGKGVFPSYVSGLLWTTNRERHIKTYLYKNHKHQLLYMLNLK